MRVPRHVLRAIDGAHRLRGMAAGPDPRIAQLRLDLDYAADGPYLDWGEYPVVEPAADLRFDADGLPQIFRAGAWHHSPVTVTQYGLQEDARARAPQADPVHARNARAVADWLVAWQDAADGCWPYHFDFPVGGMDVTLTAPWASAMAQGQAMSLLTRVAARDGHEAGLDAARRGLAPLHVDVADGGLATHVEGHVFYEEFPTRPASLALNGFQFALLGLYDLAATDPACGARELFDAGLASLVWALPKYDTGRVSAYHLGHLTAGRKSVHRSLYYHYIHIQLLTALACVADAPQLGEYAARWRAYRPRRFDPR